MHRLGCLTLLIAIFLVLLLPVLYYRTVEAALVKLGVPPDLALIFFLAMLIGSAINIPVWRVATRRYVKLDPLAVLGLPGFLPHLEELRKETTIAVNVGGCLLPAALAVYEIMRLARSERPHLTLLALSVAVGINVAVSWKLARVVPGVGIALPGLVPPLVAAAAALLFQAEAAPQVAYVAGVLGPIIGADILHLPDLRSRPVALASIGGAGTLDGIVLSGVIATLLV